MTKSKKMLFFIFIGMAMFSIARFSLYYMYNDLFKDYSTLDIIVAFLRGLRFDGTIFFTLTAVFWGLLLIPINNLRYQKIVLWLMFPVYIIMAGALIGDVLYFGYVSRHMANEPFALGEEFGFIIDVLELYIVPIVGAVIAVILLGVLWDKIAGLKIKKDKSWKHTAVYSLLWIGIIFLIIRGTVSDKPISTIDAYVSGDSNLGNLTMNGLFSSYKYFSHQSSASVSDYTFYDKEKAENILDSYRQSPCNFPEGLNISEEKKPNIVVILLESWSAYYVDSYSNNGFGLTPEFDKLAKDGIKFTRHYAPDKRSISAIQATLTGIPPITGLPSLGFGLETLAKGNVGKLLQDDGYNTLFIQSSRRRSFYMDSIAKSLGFKDYYGMEDTKIVLDYPDKSASKFGWDYETYLLLKDKINGLPTDKPFFAFTFTGTTHVPYAELPDKFMKYPHHTEKEEGFKNTLFYADWSLGQFFENIKNEEWFNNTIFIITADHNLGKFEKTSFPEDYRVPFLIYSPKIKGDGLVYDNITSHIDITPTIISLTVGSSGDDYLGRPVFCKDDMSFAVISEWNVAGIVSKQGALRDSFGQVLDFHPSDMKDEELTRLEEALLSYYQVEFTKIFKTEGSK